MQAMTKRKVKQQEAFSSKLRTEIKGRLGGCPECGRSSLSVRKAAELVGVPFPTLFRFLKGGGISGETTDKLVEWLGEVPK